MILPISGGFHAEAQFAGLYFEAESLESRRDAASPQIGLRTVSIPICFRVRAHPNLARVFIVAVEHGKRRSRRTRAAKQQLLGREVGFHGAVKIQMVARQVGEHRGMEMQAIDAPQGERVRRDLHGGVTAARLVQFGKKAHQFERLRRGVDRGNHAAGHVVFDGPDQRRDFAGGAQHRIHQEARGGFTIGAGDARQADALIGPAIEVERCQCQGVPPVRYLDPGSMKPGGRRRFAGHRDGAASQRVMRELPPVHPAARKCEKQKAFSHTPRIVVQTADSEIRKLGRKGLLQPYAGEYLA